MAPSSSLTSSAGSEPKSRGELLRAHLSTTTTTTPRRPILTSLNGDNSWLISFPRPISDRGGAGGTNPKAYFHIVTDPWLQGPAVTLHSWIFHIGLSSEPTISDGASVEAVIREIEAAAAAASGSAASAAPTTTLPTDTASPIDAIFLNFHYNDHIHEPTLRTLNPSIPVFATPQAATKIRPLNYFQSITETQDVDPVSASATPTIDWQALHPGGTLPKWLNVFRNPGHHELYFSTVIVWSPSPDVVHEALLWSPHGMRLDQPSIQAYNAGKLAPPVRTLAMLHPMKVTNVLLLGSTNGVQAGIALARGAHPKYWVRTHDMLNEYAGIAMRLLRVSDVACTFEQGLADLKDRDEWKKEDHPDVVTVGSGGCFVLE
ncbi:hypothetical protein B0H63DRAFT_401414 [Podospora didyma]|uniref:Uncharacterized protein n=1 Tax=Podospora didyma TaxID=330526 RepID=A0AAE0N6M4_9PEZI|nr:hypothetical protein B0H63DRAFT_401414 [Podospora didyma]